MTNSLNIPILLGTSREGRASENVARYIKLILEKYDDVVTDIIDPNDFTFPQDGKSPEAKDSKYSKITSDADGFLIIVPEYNHSFPGSLKRMLDSEYENYFHKAVAFAGVSAGPWGGTRAVESLVNVARELHLVISPDDVYFPSVWNLFDENGDIKDEAYEQRVKATLDTLIFYTKSMKWGRENLGK